MGDRTCWDGMLATADRDYLQRPKERARSIPSVDFVASRCEDEEVSSLNACRRNRCAVEVGEERVACR